MWTATGRLARGKSGSIYVTSFQDGTLVSYPSSAPHNSRHGSLVDFVPTGGKLSALAYATVSLFDVDRHWSIGPRQERVVLCHVFPGRHTSSERPRQASVCVLPRVGAGEVLPKSALPSPERHNRATFDGQSSSEKGIEGGSSPRAGAS